MIMIPVLILQIFLLPLATNVLMNVWVDSRRALALQDVSGSLGSAMQQLYFSLNRDTIRAGTVTYSPGLPPFIENACYVGNATLSSGTDPKLDSTFLELTVRLVGTSNSVTTVVILGPNVLWQQSFFVSNSTSASINAQKLPNGTISLQFGE